MQLQELHNLIPNMDSLKQNQTDQVLRRIRETYNQIGDQDISFAMYKISEHIMGLKVINPENHGFLQQCIKDIIRISVQRGFAVGTQALRNIFNTEAGYYQHSKLDPESKYPLGFIHPLKLYYPQLGEQCDIVNPYVSSISFCGWTRATIISKQGERYLVKYANSQVPTQTKQQPFCAPLGQRTLDFEWRMNLKEGDQVDAYHKLWYLGTVTKTEILNGTKKVKVTFKVFNQNGAFQNQNGQKYDGFQDCEDEQYDVTSYRIQKPGKMSKKFCAYSLTSSQFIIDDTYDIIFQKQYQEQKFKAIMRSSLAKSQSFLEFYQTFCDVAGNEAFLNLLQNYNKDNLDQVFNVMIVIANSSFLVPRMRTHEFLPQMLNRVVKFLYDNTKNLSPQRNQMASFYIDVVSKRIISLSQKHQLINQIRKRLALDFLKLNMQKQMIALRLLYELINPMPRKYSQSEKQEVDQFLRKNDIFYQVIQPNTHEQILLRSVQFIKYLLKNAIISFKQIQYLWNIYPPTDLRGKSTVQKMIGQLSKAFSIKDTKKLIDKILTYRESELTVDNLALLRTLKDHQQLQDDQRLKVLLFVWQIITSKSMSITSTIQEQVEKVFKSIIPTLQSNRTKLQLLKLLLNRLSQVKQLNNEFQIMKLFILTYPEKATVPSSSNNDILKIQQEQQTAKQIIVQIEKTPSTISQVVDFLKQRNIYDAIINIFNQLKSPQKTKNVLWFTAFLFQHDKDNVNGIAKVFYDKMGPSDVFLDWAQHITQKAHQFFVQSFGSLNDISKYQNLSSSGFEALKVIILDVNIKQGNMKLIKKQKDSCVQSQALVNNNANCTPKGPVYGPPQKPETVTFLYLLKSPFQCKGMLFLQQLLCVVKNNKVYDQIIKLIIQFFVNLDQSIQGRTKQFREQFLMNVIQKFEEINQKNEYNDNIKLKLEIPINLIQQLFAETQKEGLLDIKPHFECIQGQILKLKIQNHLASNKVPDFKMQISQNATLWSFKLKLAQLLKQKPQQLNVYKFVNPIADEFNAKSLSDLHLFNDESIKVMRKGVKEILRKQLLNQTGERLHPKLDQIVQKWFSTYKNEGMGRQELTRLSNQCWRGSMLKQMSKLEQMLKKFDKDQKGYLNLEEFKEFFIFRSKQNPSAIWKIINLSGYRNNFKHRDQPCQQQTPDIYPRRILSNQKVYETIFAILQNRLFQPVHLNFYRLLALLETDRSLMVQVKKNAKTLIQDQSSVFKLSYILETVLSQILINDEFYLEFYRNKGCEFIFHKLSSFMTENKSIYSLDTLIKTIIMPNMVKILNSYIFCLNSQNRMVRLVRKLKINQIQLDFLSSQIKNISQVLQEKNQQQQRLSLLRSIQQVQINPTQYHQLAQKIYFNLIQNFNSDLLQKITNQIIRMYCSLSLSQNKLNRQQIVKGLKCQSLNYRRSCQNLAYLYLLNNQIQVKNFLEYLLLNLPEQNKVIYSYFFILLQKVLQMYLDLKKQDKDDTQFIQLADKLFQKLFNDIQNENRNSLTSDKLLLGVLIVINIIFVKREGVRKAFKHMKKQLMQRCLFFYHPQERIAQVQITPEMLKTQKQLNHFKDYVKCKSQDSRKVLMQIIFHLHEVSAQQDPTFVDQYILPILNDLPKQKRKFETKTLQVGLNNLGSTCYLNSMLQVINAVTPFRNMVMQSDSQAPLVKELKNLFSSLFFSQRQDYIPEDLLKAFLPPIQKGIQQDTTEFLNILLDQLQGCLKETSQSNLLQGIFQGTQAAQMICHACGQKRQRKETFFTYSVQIQDKYDLKSALQGMQTGQLITDCLCEQCGQRSDTTKRTVIEVIPNLFFVHLKRIVFNYDVFMNTKIHTRLQFPSELDFQPYTKQGLQLRQSLGVQYMKGLKQDQQQRKKFEQLRLHQKDKDYYKLKLRGVIVHSGGPEVGHYWAITKKQASWVKFDDSRVNVFPNSNMESQCFGGNFQSDQWGGMGTSTNAYVLLYEKQLKTDIVLGCKQNRRVVPFDKIQTLNRTQLYKQVWLDNHSLMLQNHLLRDTYCRQFIHFLVQMLKISPSNSKVQIISETLYKVCFHSGQTGKLMDAFMENIAQIQPTIFKSYILGEKQRTFDLLLHVNANVREFTATFIEKVLIQTFSKGQHQDRNLVLCFIDEYLQLLHHDVAKHWLRIDGYFRLFDGLVSNSFGIAGLHQFLIDKHLIAYFIDFILQKSSPLNIHPKKYSIGTKSNPAQFGNAIKLILLLIKRSYGLTGQNYQVPVIDQKDLYHLSDNDVLCLSSMGFFQKMLREKQNMECLGLIIQRLSIKNILFSQAVARVMLITLNQITDVSDDMAGICNCLSNYLIINDEHWVKRAQFVLGYSSPYIFNDNLFSSLDEQRFVYYSTLQDLFPIQCLLAYCHLNRLRNPQAVLHILRAILQGCSVNETSIEYIVRQKSPSYLNQRYLDWVKPYLNNIAQTLNISKERKQAIVKQVQICNAYIRELQQGKRPADNIITGKVGNENVVERFTDQDNTIEVVISNVQTYCLHSQPTGLGNTVLDHYLEHGRLNKKATEDSNILCFFKQFSKPLAIKQVSQQAQEKQLESLFDDCFDKKEQQKSNQNQNNTQKQQQKQNGIASQVQPSKDPLLNTQSVVKIIQQHKQQEVAHQINVPGVYLASDYLRKIEVINNSGKTKRVTLLFKTGDNSNMLVPSKVSFLSTKKTVQKMWICKIDSKEGWGLRDYQLIVEQKQGRLVQKSFKLYGRNQAQQQKPQAMYVQEPEQFQHHQQQYQANPQGDEIIGEMICPVCTLLNLSTQSNCEVCGSSLRG